MFEVHRSVRCTVRVENHWLRPVVLNFECCCRTTQKAGHAGFQALPQDLRFSRSEVGPRIYLSTKFLGDADATGVATTLRATGLTRRKGLLGVEMRLPSTGSLAGATMPQMASHSFSTPWPHTPQ